MSYIIVLVDDAFYSHELIDLHRQPLSFKSRTAAVLLNSFYWLTDQASMSFPHYLPGALAHLIFSNDSLSQNTIVCPEWRLSFELKREDGIVYVTRTDTRFPEPFLVATWERHEFSTDKLRIVNPGGYDTGNLPVNSLLPKTSGYFSVYSYVQ